MQGAGSGVGFRVQGAGSGVGFRVQGAGSGSGEQTSASSAAACISDDISCRGKGVVS